MKIIPMIKLYRPKQWVKNLIVFVPIFFAGKLLDTFYLVPTIWAFVSLCLISSTVYVLNDIFDLKRDRLHPVKKYRPLASGKVTLPQAFVLLCISLLAWFIVTVFIVKSEYFAILCFGYLTMMVLYTFVLKGQSIIDTIVIALGFVLRVIAGAILVQVNFSAMLAVTVIGFALLISFGKRKAETIGIDKDVAIKHRPSMEVYPPMVLDNIIAGLFAITFMSYIIFSYDFSVTSFSELISQALPPLLSDPHWLLVTVPIAFYVLTRYMIIIYEKDVEILPEEIWFKDKKIFIAISLWGIILFALIYLPIINRM